MTSKMTPAERHERWWSRNPLPFYVSAKEKYGERVFLIKTRLDLTDVSFALLKERQESGYYGQTDWFFTGTYDEYVKSKIGMSIEQADEMLGSELVAPELKALRDRYSRLKEAYQQEQTSIQELERINKIVSGELPRGHAISILMDRAGAEYEGFEIQQFDTISTEDDDE